MFTITRQDERAYNTEYQGDEKQNQQHWKKDLAHTVILLITIKNTFYLLEIYLM